MDNMEKAKPEVKITLGGKERTLKLDLNGIAAFQKVTGKSFTGEMQNGKIMDSMRELLWACLQHENLTVEQVGAMCPVSRLEEIGTALVELFNQSLPGKKEGETSGPLPSTG